MANRTDLMAAVMFMGYKKQGWSERVDLIANTPAAALAALNDLMNQRKTILPDNAEILYGRVSYLGRPREAFIPDVAFPIAGTAHAAHAGPPAYTPVAEDANDVETAVHIRFGTDTGRWAALYFRCLPDDVVEKGALASALTFPATNPSPNEATWYERLVNYITLIGTLGTYARLITPGTSSSPPTYDAQGWTTYQPRGLSNRKTGRPFGTPRGRRVA